MGYKRKTIENGVLREYRGRGRIVVIPPGVTEIGRSVFACCRELESVTIPAGVTVIGDRAFFRCRNLKAITLPEGLEVIGESAFADCEGLAEINIPDSLDKIGKAAFRGCTRLKLTGEPDCVPDIGVNAFKNVDPQIPESFLAARKRKIDIYSGCIVTVTNLRRHKNDDRLRCTMINGSNVIVDDACRIGSRMVYFPVGGQLDETFARENHLLRGDAFGNRTGYYLHPVRRNIAGTTLRGEASEGLALPVEVLEKYTDIQSLRDGDRIFTLNGYQICCIYISGEMDIDIRYKTLLRYNGGADSRPKVYIPWGIEHIEDGAFMHSRRVEEVIVPETVKTIGKRAFYDCPKLKNVEIPDSVTRIGTEAFANCKKLMPMVLPGRLNLLENDIFVAKDFTIENGILVKYNGAVRDVIIPEGVTEIGDVAFSHNSEIESVKIPAGVTKIGKYAFRRCRRLRKVSIPDGVNYIGDEAFFECRALRKVTLPSSVEYIGSHAFGEYYFFKYVYGLKFPIDEYRKYKNFRLCFTEPARGR